MTDMSSGMANIGANFSDAGSLMNQNQLEDARRKQGKCITCGQKCFQKKLFKMIPITEHGKVLDGRCLKCKPLEVKSSTEVLPAVSRPATRQDLERFTRSQSNLQLQGPGVRAMRRIPSNTPQSATNSPVPEGEEVVPNPRTGVAAAVRPPPLNVDSGDEGFDDSVRSGDGRPRRRYSGGPRRPVRRSSASRSPVHSTLRREGQGKSSRSMDSVGTWSSGGGGTPYKMPATNGGNTMMDDAIIEASRMDEEGVAPASMNHNGGGGATAEEDEFENIHKAVLGRMAAQQLARNFRSRKLHRASEAADEEGAAGDGDDHDNTSWDNQPSSLHSRDSRSFGDDEDLQMPDHGVLDRGGQVVFDNLDASGFPRLGANAESARTMSSMSSAEEDSASRQQSWKRSTAYQKQNAPSAVMEDDEQQSGTSEYSESMRSSSHISKHSAHSSSSRQSSMQRLVQRKEDQAMSLLQNADGDFREILSVMKQLPSSYIIQQEGLKDLSNLHLSNSEYDELAQIGALETVITAMRTHPHETEVQICGCRAIWNLSATAQNQLLLVEAGALDVILTSMEGFPSDSEVQEKAMAALSNLGAAEGNHESILDQNVIEKIVEAMNRHSEDGNVQAKACSAITNFASYDSPLKRQIMESGGGGAVVISMIMHPEDVDLQEKALRALRNICANSDENKVEVANVGGIDAVISSMQVHRDEPGVQEAGAWTLSNLAVNPDNKAIIGDSGGIDVIIRAMWVHSDNAGVQEWCSRALWTLSVDAQNRQVMMEVGGISAIINSMQAHADAPTVQEKGCGVLSNLAATDDKSKIRIVEEEALDAIVMAMVLHADNQAVQDRACSVLKRLAVGPNIQPMKAANVGEVVRVAGEKFPHRCGDKANQILSVL